MIRVDDVRSHCASVNGKDEETVKHGIRSDILGVRILLR
jgi:hypothetical protein